MTPKPGSTPCTGNRPREVIAGRRRAVLGPSLLANQRHEADVAECFFIKISLGPARDPQQRLITFAITNRDNKAAIDGQFLPQRVRHRRAASGDQDRVERRFIGQAAGAVASMHNAILISEFSKPLGGDPG